MKTIIRSNLIIASKKKQETISNNLKVLSERSKQLGKPVPDEVRIIIYLNQPIGSKMFEKYKEWLI